MSIIGSRQVRAAVVAAVLAMSACLDAPTVPEAVQQIAGGEAWVAIPEPRDLPTLDTWMPYGPAGERGAAVRARIDALLDESREAAYAGDLEWSTQLRTEATRIAVLSVERLPEPHVMAGAVRSVEEWAERVRIGVDLRVYPEVASSVRRVERSLGAARAALEAGDTTAAIIPLSDASERIRRHGPTSVALRVLDAAEARLRARAPSPPVLERAVHLIRSARHELVGGEPSRALRRALYALQLADG